MTTRDEEKKQTLEVVVTIRVDMGTISSLITDAIEQGAIGYWAELVGKICPSQWVYEDDLPREGGGHWMQDYPLNPGGGLWLRETETENAPRLRFDLDAIRKGIQLMSQEAPEHFANLISESSFDATTADVLFQFALLGEIVYG